MILSFLLKTLDVLVLGLSFSQDFSYREKYPNANKKVGTNYL